MQKKFFSNLLLLLFLNLLIKPFWLLGIDREVQNVVGAEEYGLYNTLFQFSFLFHMLLDFGINNFNNRNIAQNRQLLNKHLGGLTLIKVGLGVVYLIVALCAGFYTGYTSTYFGLLLLLCFNQFLLSFIQYFRSNLAALHLFRMDSVLSVLDRGLVILFCSVLLWGNLTDTKFRIEWFVYAQTVAYLLTMLTAGIAVLSKSGRLKFSFKPAFALSILRQSYPYALLVLLMTFYFRVDAVMIEQMLPDGKTQSGIYAQGFRLLDAANIFAYLFAVLLLPIFSRMLKQKEKVSPLVGLSSRLLLGPAIAVSVVAVFFAKPLMELMYDANTVESIPVFSVLIMGFIPLSATYIFGTLLTANGNLKYLNFMAVGGVIVNIGLNAWLIPDMGPEGAAIASLITQVLTALAQLFLASAVFSFKINWKLMASLSFFSGLAIAICWFVQQQEIHWLQQLSIALVTISVLAFVIRLIDLGALFRLMRESTNQTN